MSSRRVQIALKPVAQRSRGSARPLTGYGRSGTEPIRCPFDTYVEVAEAVAAMNGFFKIEELQKAVNALVDRPASSYQVRMCLRYWICRGIVPHKRAILSGASGRGFVDAAVKLFNSLADGAHRLACLEQRQGRIGRSDLASTQRHTRRSNRTISQKRGPTGN